ncbi:MAG: signal recognition particle-docking protein FtsY [Acidimicrobiales bacterium]|nr:signal recognition particle-docking protein FtsY [Acidimicrobiales bacterium]
MPLYALILIIVFAVALLGSVGGAVLTRTRRRDLVAPPPKEPVAPPARPPTEAPPSAEAPAAPPEVAQAPAAAPEVVAPPEPAPVEPAPVEPETVEPAVEALLARPRFRDRLTKARAFLSDSLGSAIGGGRLDDATWDGLEEALIRADVGVKTTMSLVEDLRGRAKAGEIRSPSALVEALKGDLTTTMGSGERGLCFEPSAANVWLFVGVNGAGKTTTIGKVAMREASAGRSVVVAAGDTFRAAATEQLDIWAQRVGADVVKGAEGGDPSSVVFDAVQRAAASHADLVLADTAGRLHTKVNLMEELKKVRRVAERPPGRVTEVLLVIDATTGQNGLVQARQFTEAVGVTGVVLTKLDGTAKGGIAVAIQTELGLPIKLVGLGEKAGDLVEFDPEEFVEALFA